ncbi:MAG: glycosyltransferase family 4 protein [Coleofasciculaceae cyanobacterium SM2_1_6]|nr:glycosyltransferase family 4 protein [Coleofasciculaceae cyanobacterium SM2_1_6]
MRIIIYSYNYYPEPIGIAPLMTELAEGLVKRGHEVRVVTGMPNYPERQIYPSYRGKLYTTELRNGVAIQRSYVLVRPRPNLLERVVLDASFVVSSFIHALRGKRPDVVFLTSPPLPIAVPAALLGWLHRCPVILNLQDIIPEAAIHVGLLSNKKLIWVFEGLEKFAYRTATKISIIADQFADNLISKGVSPQKLVVIPNWVDTNFIFPMSKDHNNYFRTDYKLEGKFVFMYSGNIGLTQGLETVVRAAKLLVNLPELVVVVVGEEKAIGRLQKFAQQLGATNVMCVPFQPRNLLPQMLAAMDVGLVLQKQNVIAFNMPSKIQPILASGRPIIASVPLNGTAAGAVRSSGGGLVVPPEDINALAGAMVNLYKNRQQAAELGKCGREYALQHFSFEQALDNYENLFLSVQKSSK